jgi:hypothetical protein
MFGDVRTTRCAQKKYGWRMSITKRLPGLLQAVRQLQCSTGTCTRPEYERLQRTSDQARVKSGQVRPALEQHIATHGC